MLTGRSRRCGPQRPTDLEMVGRTGLGPPKNLLLRGGVGAAGRIALAIWVYRREFGFGDELRGEGDRVVGDAPALVEIGE